MYSSEESSGIKSFSALNLLRYKTIRELKESPECTKYMLGLEDVNEVLLVAGLPIIMEDEFEPKELDVISTEKEDAE